MKRFRNSALLVVLGLVLAVGIVAAASSNFRAHLAGKYVIPVSIDTQAQGQAIFNLSSDGLSMDYQLNAANIDNVFMAHIHQKNAGGPGPIVVWLYPATAFAPSQTVPPASWIEGRFDGVLAQGTFSAADFKGPLAGKTMADLAALIESGALYVNVHTSDFVLPNNTGAGDMFGGEMQGMIH